MAKNGKKAGKISKLLSKLQFGLTDSLKLLPEPQNAPVFTPCPPLQETPAFYPE
jgi:hypothetical protein